MKQQTFGAVTGFEKHYKVSKRPQFLAEMEHAVGREHFFDNRASVAPAIWQVLPAYFV